jgi:hypothetical protein
VRCGICSNGRSGRERFLFRRPRTIDEERIVGDENVVSGVRFGRRRAADAGSRPGSPSSPHERAIELLVEGTGVLADALATLAAHAGDDVRAQAMRARCDVLTRLIREHAGELAGRRATRGPDDPSG